MCSEFAYLRNMLSYLFVDLYLLIWCNWVSQYTLRWRICIFFTCPFIVVFDAIGFASVLYFCGGIVVDVVFTFYNNEGWRIFITGIFVYKLLKLKAKIQYIEIYHVGNLLRVALHVIIYGDIIVNLIFVSAWNFGIIFGAMDWYRGRHIFGFIGLAQ